MAKQRVGYALGYGKFTNVREMAETAGTNRDAVLKTIAPRVPAYQDAMRDIENLKNRNQELSAQLSQTQSDLRKVEGELRNQVSEVNRLRKDNSALQDKIDTSTAQMTKLSDEIRNFRGLAQGYQKELANVQRSLNLRVDTNRDLAAQIADIGQVMQKLQKDNASLEGQNGSLKQSLDNQQAANTKLVGENDDLKNSNRQMRETISSLTSKEDSLARQFLHHPSATGDQAESVLQAEDARDTGGHVLTNAVAHHHCWLNTPGAPEFGQSADDKRPFQRSERFFRRLTLSEVQEPEAVCELHA